MSCTPAVRCCHRLDRMANETSRNDEQLRSFVRSDHMSHSTASVKQVSFVGCEMEPARLWGDQLQLRRLTNHVLNGLPRLYVEIYVKKKGSEFLTLRSRIYFDLCFEKVTVLSLSLPMSYGTNFFFLKKKIIRFKTISRVIWEENKIPENVFL